MYLKHSRESEMQIVLHKESTAGAGREYVSLRELADVIRAESHFRHPGEVEELGESRIELRIGGDPIHVAQDVLFAEETRSCTQYEAASLVDLVVSSPTAPADLKTCSGTSIFGRHPFHRFIDIAKNANAALSPQLTMDFVHSGKSVQQIVRYQERATRLSGEYVRIGYLTNLFGAAFEFRHLPAIHQLRESRTNRRVGN
jgi:hypothetical protein